MITLEELQLAFAEKLQSEMSLKSGNPFQSALLKVSWIAYQAGYRDGLVDNTADHNATAKMFGQSAHRTSLTSLRESLESTRVGQIPHRSLGIWAEDYQDNFPWHDYSGKDNPVHADDIVVVRFKSGSIITGQSKIFPWDSGEVSAYRNLTAIQPTVESATESQ